MKSSKNSCRILGVLVLLLMTIHCDGMKVKVCYFDKSNPKYVLITYRNEFDGLEKNPSYDFYQSYTVKLDDAWTSNDIMNDGKLKENQINIFSNRGTIDAQGAHIPDEVDAIDEGVGNSNLSNSKIFESFAIKSASSDSPQGKTNSWAGKPSNLFGNGSSSFCWELEVKFKEDIKIIFAYPRYEFAGSGDKKTRITINFIDMSTECKDFVLLWSVGHQDKKNEGNTKEPRDAFELISTYSSKEFKRQSFLYDSKSGSGNSSPDLFLFTSPKETSVNCPLSDMFVNVSNEPLTKDFFPGVYELDSLQFTDNSEVNVSLVHKIPTQKFTEIPQTKNSHTYMDQRVFIFKLAKSLDDIKGESVELPNCSVPVQISKDSNQVGIRFYPESKRRKLVV